MECSNVIEEQQAQIIRDYCEEQGAFLRREIELLEALQEAIETIENCAAMPVNTDKLRAVLMGEDK